MTIKTGFLGQIHHASDYAEFGLHSIGNGICNYLNNMQVISNNSMTVTIRSGFALLNGYFIFASEDQTLVIPEASPLNPRYDAIIVQVDYTQRLVSCQLVKGEASATPTKYVPVRNNFVYELVLANLYVRASTSQVISSDIEDTRFNPNLCGYIPQQPEINSKLVQLTGINLDTITQMLQVNTAEATRLVTYADSTLSDMVDDVDSILTPIMITVGKIIWSAEDLSLNSRFLLCNGSEIPGIYPELMEYLGDNILPDLSAVSDKIRAYICAIDPN